MTESTAMCCLLPPEFHTYQTVGVPVPSNEIKLVDGAFLSPFFPLFLSSKREMELMRCWA